MDRLYARLTERAEVAGAQRPTPRAGHRRTAPAAALRILGQRTAPGAFLPLRDRHPTGHERGEMHPTSPPRCSASREHLKIRKSRRPRLEARGQSPGSRTPCALAVPNSGESRYESARLPASPATVSSPGDCRSISESRRGSRAGRARCESPRTRPASPRGRLRCSRRLSCRYRRRLPPSIP